MREIILLWPRPELTHILIGLDGLVPELEPVLGSFPADAANVDIADDIVEVIELDRPARRVGQIHALESRQKLFLVAGVTAGRLKARIDDLAVDIEAGRIEAGNGVVVLDHTVDKSVIGV